MHDVIVVGAGIVGLAHALAAARRGKSVLVIDRDAQANGASIRNFGFVTVTGQERGRVWDLALRSAAIWREIAGPAGIAIEQEGLLLVAQREEAQAVLDAFLATEMGDGCKRLTGSEAQALCPAIPSARAALISRHDLRVESRTAIPLLARWLEREHGVAFRWGSSVLHAETGAVHCSDGVHRAERVFLCPGDDWATLCPDIYAQAEIVRCKLQMLRLAAPGWTLPAPVMSDLSLARYLGYAALPEARVLLARLEREQPAALAQGIHIIAVQSAGRQPDRWRQPPLCCDARSVFHRSCRSGNPAAVRGGAGAGAPRDRALEWHVCLRRRAQHRSCAHTGCDTGRCHQRNRGIDCLRAGRGCGQRRIRQAGE